MASVLYFLFLSPSSPIPFDARNACRSLSVNGDVDKTQTWGVLLFLDTRKPVHSPK